MPSAPGGRTTSPRRCSAPISSTVRISGRSTRWPRSPPGVGLDQAEARAYLASDADSEAIRAEDQYAREIGIQGVPCYIIDRRYALSGAQPPEAFLHVFDIASQPDSKDKAELA